MLQWWEGLDLLSQILYCVAIPSSLILVLQTLLMIIGFGHGGEGVNPSDTSGLDLDPDFDFHMHGDMDFHPHGDTNFHPHGDTSGDGTGHGDYGALRLFSLQGIIAFFAVFSWTSIVTYHAGMTPALAILLGLGIGFLAMYGVAKLFSLSRGLSASGNISLNNALGVTGKVYIPIAPGSQGKVTLVVQDRLIEADAVTDAPKTLPSGAMVRVVDIRAGMLVVEYE